jgi:hypothetical protein
MWVEPNQDRTSVNNIFALRRSAAACLFDDVRPDLLVFHSSTVRYLLQCRRDDRDGSRTDKDDVRLTSALLPIATRSRTSLHVSDVPLSDIRDPWLCGSITSSSPRTCYALTVQNRFAPMSADVCFPNLRAPGAPEGLCRLSRRFEGGECIFSCHSNSCLNVRQTASPRRSQHRRSCSLFVRELTNDQPVVVTKMSNTTR